MRGFLKAFAFMMLGLGLMAAPGYWTYVSFLSATTLTEKLVFESGGGGRQTGAGGAMSVYLTPEMNPLQILGRLDIISAEGRSPNLNVAVWSGDQQIWAATAILSPNYNVAAGRARPTAVSVILGTLYVSEPGEYSIRGSVGGADKAQLQRLSMEIRRDVISIRWEIFGVGILLLLAAVILYRIADADEG